MSVKSETVWNIAPLSQQSRRLPFYLIECGHFLARKDYFTKREGSNMYLVFVTLKGKGKLWHSGKEHVLDEKSIVVLSCYDIHEYRTFEGMNWDFLWFTFNGSGAKEYHDLINPSGINVLHSPNIKMYCDWIWDIIDNSSEQEITKLLDMSELISKILSTIIKERAEGIRKNVQKRDKVKNVLEYIDYNYMKKITIEDLASMMYTSKYHFIRIFKACMGITPHEYLVNVRVKKVRELLVTTTLPVYRIAEMTGFVDSKNLIRNFKKSTDVTPGNYRKIMTMKKIKN